MQLGGNVAVMAPAFAQNLFLLSPALHWAVLINTNAWYGCEELKSVVGELLTLQTLCAVGVAVERTSR